VSLESNVTPNRPVRSARLGASPLVLSELARVFPLPWSHYVLLIARSRSPEAFAFYHAESAREAQRVPPGFGPATPHRQYYDPADVDYRPEEQANEDQFEWVHGLIIADLYDGLMKP
jgi:hypothetical protein